MTPDIPQLADVVQRNCDISDARFAGDYGLCTFLLKMREFYRWENELPFTRDLPKDDLGEWLTAREEQWNHLESDDFLPLPLPFLSSASHAALDPFDAIAANRQLLPQGYVYSAGYGRFQKPLFFLGRLLRVEERAGLTILVSSCEYARELAAPPAMLQGKTIFLRQESVRRYLWEKIEEWHWSKLDNTMARALASYEFTTDTEAALVRMTENETESMILHEVGEALAGDLLGEAWREMVAEVSRTRAEIVARAVRDMLADCLSTLPVLIECENLRALHFYFATFDAPRRQLFPQLIVAYEGFLKTHNLKLLAQAVSDGKAHWLKTAQHFLALHATDKIACRAALEAMLDGLDKVKDEA